MIGVMFFTLHLFLLGMYQCSHDIINLFTTNVGYHDLYSYINKSNSHLHKEKPRKFSSLLTDILKSIVFISCIYNNDDGAATPKNRSLMNYVG